MLIQQNSLMIKKLIEQQKNENSKSLYKIIDSFLINKSKSCSVCGDIIFYDKSHFSFKNDILKKQGKSDETIKIVNGKEYHLCVCQDCLSIKFPIYKIKKEKNDRFFNTLSEITKFAFNIDDTDFNLHKKKYAVTLNSLINKYGNEEGNIKYKEYCQLQSITNKFEYKNKKYGWTKEQFDEFNKSRAVTLDNLIKRHGQEKGEELFNSYKERQSYAGNKLEYFIEKYGYLEGNKKYAEVCSFKAITLKNMIRIHGEEAGRVKYENFIKIHKI